ncbi:MAG: SH3 domain-containing protein [Ruminococcus sp.]|nr:SH3 domain-containing protein [Ruminococcus sp.]
MKTTRNSGFLVTAVSVTLVLCIFMLTVCTASFSTSAAATNVLKSVCSLNLRSSAKADAEILTVVPSGASVTLLQSNTTAWVKVKYSTYTGYCSSDLLQPDSDSGITMKGKTTADVNLRSGKGTSYSSLTVVPNNTAVTVNSNADASWAKVTYSGKTGYIRKDFILITFTLAVVSTTKAPVNSYKAPDYSKAPQWYSYSLTDKMLNTDAPSSNKLMLDTTKLNLKAGEKHNLIAFMSGSNPVMDNIEFKSSDSKVASVSAKGVVTALKAGKTTITAIDAVSLYTAKCEVYVSGNIEPSEETQPSTAKPTQPQTQPSTAKPTQPSTSKPTQPSTAQPSTAKPTVAETLSISHKSVTMYLNNHFVLTATSNATVKWYTSDESIVKVSQKGLIVSKGVGTATITAKTSTKSVTCKVTVKKPSVDVNVSHREMLTLVAGKTFFASSSTPSVSWSSSNTKVATVKNGFILGVAPGRSIITASTTGGAKTILIDVVQADPIRFAYSSPNCAPKNRKVNFVAITDKTRTAVRFNVTINGTTKTIDATSKTAEGSTYVWKGSTTFSAAGTYNVKAYSKKGTTWSTCSDGATTAFVTASTNKTTTACANRRASDEIINLIASYEGYMSSVYSDALTGDPTLGYGKLVYVGQQFYNSLTKSEAYAYLVQTVNNDGYSSKVNSFLVGNAIKFNQQQFDALVCFVYNTGTGVLSNDDDIRNALLNCSSGSSSSSTSYYINGSDVRIRKGPGTSYDIIDELSYGTTITIVEKTNSSWYRVKLSDGTLGYVSTDYISSRTTDGSLDLNYVKKQTVINKFCQYHHAGGCIYGLLYRRVDEMEVFFYNDYDRNYGTYKYNINFTCANNSSFHT